MGRPSEYQPEYAAQAEKLCLLGARDVDLADFFEVSEQTINAWKKAQPEFLESVKSGKRVADANVASKLYSRACGAEVMTQQAFKVKKVEYVDGKRSSETEEVVTVPVLQVSPPDTTACIFWLKNRKSDDWRDKQDHEHSGEVAIKRVVADL